MRSQSLFGTETKSPRSVETKARVESRGRQILPAVVGDNGTPGVWIYSQAQRTKLEIEYWMRAWTVTERSEISKEAWLD